MPWDLSNLPAAVNPKGLSRDQIVSLLESSTRMEDASFEILDRKTRLPVSFPGGTPSDLSAMNGRVTAAKVKMTQDRDTLRSMPNFDMWAPLTIGFDPRVHLIRPYVDRYETEIAWDGSGGRAVRDRLLHVPLGIFDVQVPDETWQGRDGLWQMTAEDLTRKITDKRFAHNWVIKRGQNVVQDQVVKILTNGPQGATPAGCECPGPGYPAGKMYVTPSDETVQTDQVWSRSNQQVKVVNDALAGIGYWPMGLDHDAWVEILPQPYWAGPDPVAEWSFYGDERSIVGLPLQRTLGNKNDWANWVQIVVNPPGATAFSVIVKNESPYSFISIPNYGDVIEAPEVQTGQIATAETAYIVGQNIINQRAIAAEALSWTGMIVPFLGNHTWCNIEVKAKGQGRIVRQDNEISVVYGADTYVVRTTTRPWLCISWEYDLVTKQGTYTLGQNRAI